MLTVTGKIVRVSCCRWSRETKRKRRTWLILFLLFPLVFRVIARPAGGGTFAVTTVAVFLLLLKTTLSARKTDMGLVCSLAEKEKSASYGGIDVEVTESVENGMTTTIGRRKELT